jgi:hypothetical protein
VLTELCIVTVNVDEIVIASHKISLQIGWKMREWYHEENGQLKIPT